MPPDRLLLPQSVLAALGLVSVAGCGPCLQYDTTDLSGCLCLDECNGWGSYTDADTDADSDSDADTDADVDTGADSATTDTGSGGHSGDTGAHTADTGSAARVRAPSPVLERLEGVLPPDVVERLRRR